MKNFDLDRQVRVDQDRSFQINGQTFTHKPAVAPEALLGWSAMVGGEFVERDENGTILLGPDALPISSLSEQKALEIYESTILTFLEAGQEERWAEVRNPAQANPINLKDLTDLITWLFEETSGRPTGPSSSSSGSGAGGANGVPETPLTPSLPPPVAVPPASTT